MKKLTVGLTVVVVTGAMIAEGASAPALFAVGLIVAVSALAAATIAEAILVVFNIRQPTSLLRYVDLRPAPLSRRK